MDTVSNRCAGRDCNIRTNDHSASCLAEHQAAAFDMDRPPFVSLFFSGHWRNFQSSSHRESTMTEPEWHTTDFVQLDLMCPEIAHRHMGALLNTPGALSPRESELVRRMVHLLAMSPSHTAASGTPFRTLRTGDVKFHRKRGWAEFIGTHHVDSAMLVWEEFDVEQGAATGSLFYAERSEFDLEMKLGDEVVKHD